MDELRKVVRVVTRKVPGAPHETLLVLDGSVGQNAIQQGRLFGEAVQPTGVIVTKLDGTARGGAVAALRRELGRPDPVRRAGRGRRRPRAVRCARLRGGTATRISRDHPASRSSLRARHPDPVPQGCGREAGRRVRPPRHPHRARPRVAPPPSLSRRIDPDAAGEGPCRRRDRGGGPRHGQAGAADAEGAPDLSCGAARRLGTARVRLAGPGLPRPHHPRGTAAARVRARCGSITAGRWRRASSSSWAMPTTPSRRPRA